MPSIAPDADHVSRVEVAVGLIQGDDGRILIARRRPDQPLGGLREFPGGKLEPGEAAEAALCRELHEELGLRVQRAVPCLAIEHAYPDVTVRLRVFRVEAWTGTPTGREGQSLGWQDPADLHADEFPPASRAILNAARLPRQYLITPSPPRPEGIPAIVEQVGAALRHGDIGLVQVRAPGLGCEDYREFLSRIHACAESAGVAVLANAPPEWLEGLPSVGIHLPERRWRTLDRRPPVSGWVAASVHDAEGLRRAAALGVDFVVASPLAATPSHPDVTPLGWDGLQALIAVAPVPVYALGGMDRGALPQARAVGAQGIAAIRGLLD
ncbi:MAG: Nudix family hydrolase [Pseudomonadota bacterium]